MSQPEPAALEGRSRTIEVAALVVGGTAGALAAFEAAGVLPVVAMPDDVTKLIWYAIRVTGIAAYVALWLTTIAGIAISGQIGGRRLPGAIVYPLHQLGDLALSLAVLHAALLLGDRYAGFTPSTLVVPFTASYRPAWTGLGIVALYLAAAVFWSAEVRPRVGYRAWRVFHYAAFAVYALALLHGLFSGTDSSSPAMLAMYVGTGAVVVWLVALRMRPAAAAAPARSAARA